jgi:outer membrane protein assembly factor BamB
MSAIGRKVLDLAEQQGLLDGKAIAELRRQVAESKFVVTPEAIAKVLVDHGHLTPFQARKLVSQALGDEPDPIEQKIVEKPKPRPPPKPVEDLTFADSTPDHPKPKPPPEIANVQPARPAPKPTAKGDGEKKPGPKKPTAPPAQIVVPKQDEKPVSPLQPPVEGSTADDFVELKSIDPAPHQRGVRWKTDSPSSLAETVELNPIDVVEPTLTPLPADGLVPIDDLFETEAVLTPAAESRPASSSRPVSASSDLLKPLAPLTPLTPLKPISPLTPLTPLQPVARRAKNIWDSPLMVFGGGSLGVILVLFALLYFALTRGSAAELFSKGEEEYRGGNYANAIAIYEQFLKRYPEDPSASLARVRRGMASLRQVTDDGQNARVGLDTAQHVLPQIEAEEKFAEARSELATILPDIADNFATQATQTEDVTKKGELVKLAGDALALVNNPAYLPASLRKEREGRIGRIVDKLKTADRGIQQEKDLAATIEKISGAIEKGSTGVAYQLQNDLVSTYPGLANHPLLVAAIRKAGQKEQQLVKVTTGGPTPFTTDHKLGSERTVVTYQPEVPAATASAPQPVFFLLEGAVYGIDAASGRVLWRRFVGYETINLPIAVGDATSADCLLVDSLKHELVRVKGASGGLVWRQKLNGEAHGPVVAGNRVLVTNQLGLVIAVDAATGEIAATAQLPQGAVVAPAVRQSRVYQLGENSTLFVLDANTLACSETVYIGHQAGELLVTPAAVLDQVLIVTSPGDDYSEIRVLSPDAKTKQLVPFGRAQRLKGRIVTPLAVSAARVAAMSDLGQVAVYDVDSAGTQEHLRLVAGLDASETSPRQAFCELERNRLWVASRRKTMFDVQAALSQLSRKWTENQDDSFLAPPRLQGEVIVLARRRSGVPAVLVEGCKALTGETVWTTHLAAPLAALAATEASPAVTGLTAEGRLYSFTNEQFQTGNVQVPLFSPPADVKNPAVLGEPSISADGQTLTWTESQVAGRIWQQNLAASDQPLEFTPATKMSAPAIAAFGGVIAPLASGSVTLLSPPGGSAVAPFLPPLVPNALPQWVRPVALADGSTFVIADGGGTVYAVAKRDQPRLHLAAAGESKTSGPIVSPLVLAGSTVLGIVRQESTDAIAGFDSRAKAAFEPVPLEGRVIAGPFVVGGIAFISAEPDGLVCISSDGRVRWQRPTEQGFLAGPPVGLPDGDLLMALQTGVVARVDAATGKELSRHDVGEPLAGPVCIWKSQAYLSGSDGVVHRVSIPPRP